MSYSFNPMSDEELDAMDVISEGVYNFEVVKSTRSISKAGNPMAVLHLKVWDNEGKTHIVFDYLVFSNVNLNIKKVSHFCKAVGLHEEYKQGQIPEELERLSGKVSLGIQGEQEKPTGGFYPKKNVVIDYIVPEGGEIKVKNNPVSYGTGQEFDDTIPF